MENNAEKKKTLKEFLDEKVNILTVFAIFNALMIFSSTIENKFFALGLSFLFMSISVVVWIEIWTSFPSGKATWTLIMFENLITITTLGIIGYWIYEYKEIWRRIIFIPTFIISASIISFIVKKTKIYDKLLPEEKTGKWNTFFRIIVGLILIYLLLMLSGLIGSLFTIPGLKFLDLLEQELGK